MKNNKLMKGLLPAAVSLAMIGQAQAAITVYDQDDTSFSVDGFFNTFYVTSDQEQNGQPDRSQSRVKMGFLPNYIGFNFAKKVDGLQLGGRSSFWVSINDSDVNRSVDAGGSGTASLIDVRQFYATVAGDFGEVLVGKDFGLFGRTSILSDEILMGYGQTITTGLDGGNVSFGNIGTGYLYPMPNAQITYRTPDMGGFKLAVGLMDPNKSNGTSEESAPRIEAEATFGGDFDGGSYKVWLGAMTQSSEQPGGGGKVGSDGVAYGANVKFGGLSLTASGFQADGIGNAGLGNLPTTNNGDVDGYLVQASYSFGSERIVASYGENEGSTTGTGDNLDLENTTVAWFHSVNSNFTLVGEYSTSEQKSTTIEVDTIALGAVINF
ncbi:porin [Motiliproteus sediminis]|uniref:porin n=1 Tax=Motiliproteus sediminis TaxID=1468178 RepID=UPI001FE55524|nr:porin [Motiliproteus sediminis]